MARLNYQVSLTFPSASPDGKVVLIINANAVGVSEARIYEESGSVPAFTAMEINPVPGVPLRLQALALAAGTYVVEYKDTLGERVLGKVILPTNPAACFPTFTDGAITVYDNKVRLSLNYTMIEGSINGGTTWKSVSGGIVEWSNSELSALGITDELTDIRYRKTTLTNQKDIDGFSASSFPGFDGPGYVAVSLTSDGSSGLLVGMTIPFFGSSLGYNSALIVAVPGPDSIIIQHPFYGDESGVTTGVLTNCNLKFAEEFVLEVALNPLAATFSVSNVTTNGGNDGSITVTPSGGSGNYSYLWNDGSTNQNKVGVVAGNYSVTVTDTVTLEEVELEMTVTEPQIAAPHVGSFLKIPLANSLHYVIEQVVDNCTIFQTPDNTLLCKQSHPYFEKTNYFQKVANCDAPITQFYSDFGAHLIELVNYQTGITLKNFLAELKEENLGKSENFNITLRNHTTPGKTRVYFNVGAPPIPVKVNDSFTVVNNADGFNGAYTITDILTDTLLGYQYLIINRNYDAPGATSAAEGQFVTSVVEFNVYEFAADMTGVAEGYYFIRITAFDNETNFKVAVSEPISVKASHPDTHFIQYRNNDNAFDVTWTTGYIGRIRVESVLFKRMPGGERSMSRNSDFSLVKVLARKQRIIMFETFLLPPYMHEKLSVVFDMDFFSINGIEYQAAEGYGEPQYLTRFFLSNSSIKLEQVGWFDQYNSDDIGSVNDGGYIAHETGFLLQ